MPKGKKDGTTYCQKMIPSLLREILQSFPAPKSQLFLGLRRGNARAGVQLVLKALVRSELNKRATVHTKA